MLSFCEKFFDILIQNNYKDVHLRTVLKITLATIQEDIKADAHDFKRRLTELINRDKTLVEEDVLHKALKQDKSFYK